MKNTKKRGMVKAGLLFLVLILMGGVPHAHAFLGFGNSASWKEEVLLHDGGKIVVTRSQTRGGRGEVGQSPIKEHSITFTPSGEEKAITWKDEYSEDVGHSNFDLLALHLLNNTPYIVASSYGCLAYNKWGRPNPPYIVFKYDGTVWQRIPLSEVPVEFTAINLVINASAHEKKLLDLGVVSAAMVKRFNSSLTQPYLKTIVRTMLAPGSIGVSCEELIRYKCGWGAPGEFNRKHFENICK